MNETQLKARLKQIVQQELPFTAEGQTAARLRDIFDIGFEDLSLAKLAEAHWDALNILHELKLEKMPNALYAVWASEIPGKNLQLKKAGDVWLLSGTKMFCSGMGFVDRAIITAVADSNVLIDIDLRAAQPGSLKINEEFWHTLAFNETKTATIKFVNFKVQNENIIKDAAWYVKRIGLWQGALGPAACWGGGAAGLVDYALHNQRQDSHTLAHLAAMEANKWAIASLLQTAGNELDSYPDDFQRSQNLALKTRHLIEQLCTDILRRFARAYGPFPLACDKASSRRYQELDLFLRQNHAERDLELLGRNLKAAKMKCIGE